MAIQPGGAVVVTGASSGIGRACALELDKAGYRVFATVRQGKDAESLKQAASERLVPVMMDVTDEASVTSASTAVAQEADGLAGLVNNAGVGMPGPIELIDVDDLRRQFEINLFGLVRVTQAFLPLIRKARGRIINIGSVGGQITIPFGGALCASKYALEAINDALRMELYPWGIHVILIAPAGVSTPAVDKLLEEGEAAIRRFPPEGLRRYGQLFRDFLTITGAREEGESAGSRGQSGAGGPHRAEPADTLSSGSRCHGVDLDAASAAGPVAGSNPVQAVRSSPEVRQPGGLTIEPCGRRSFPARRNWKPANRLRTRHGVGKGAEANRRAPGRTFNAVEGVTSVCPSSTAGKTLAYSVACRSCLRWLGSPAALIPSMDRSYRDDTGRDGEHKNGMDNSPSGPAPERLTQEEPDQHRRAEEALRRRFSVTC